MPRQKNTDRHEELAFGALQTILEKGITEFTMADVGKQAGVNRSLLYWYFPSGVSDALAAAAEVATTSRQRFVAGRISAAKHPVLALDAWVCATLAFHDDDGRLAKIIATAGRAHELMTANRAQLVDALRRGIADGNVAACDAEGIVTMCADAVEGALIRRNGHTDLAGIQWLRTNVLATLHTGDWLPAPLRRREAQRLVRAPSSTRATAPIAIQEIALTAPVKTVEDSKMFETAKTAEARKTAENPVKKQVVRPRGSWLELD